MTAKACSFTRDHRARAHASAIRASRQILRWRVLTRMRCRPDGAPEARAAERRSQGAVVLLAAISRLGLQIRGELAGPTSTNAPPVTRSPDRAVIAPSLRSNTSLFIKSVRACGLDLSTRHLLMTGRCRLDAHLRLPAAHAATIADPWQTRPHGRGQPLSPDECQALRERHCERFVGHKACAAGKRADLVPGLAT